MIPDWQLPPGVDRGLWDYLHAADMVAGYDEQMRASHLARADLAFCEHAFRTPGRLLDLGCGTGRLCAYFAAKGFECVGVDLSDEMLAKARARTADPSTPSPEGRGSKKLPFPLSGKGAGVGSSSFLKANLVEPTELPEQSFDYAACLFSTLGMVRGAENRAKVLANAFRLLKPGGKFVLHVHNRFFRGLGLLRVAGQFFRTLFERPSAGDIAMSQAYGGSSLTLHHFMRREAVMSLWEAGFAALDVHPLRADGARAGWPTPVRAYGWLILAERPTTDPRER